MSWAGCAQKPARWLSTASPTMPGTGWEGGASASASQGDADVFAELFALYQAATDSRMCEVLDGDLPALLAVAQPLGPALRGCPDAVALALGGELASRLAPPRADVALAARVFAARAAPRG